MVKLRTTITPTEEIDVSPAEATDLKAMGLVLDMTKTRATTEQGLTEAAIRQVAVTGAADTDDHQSGDAAGDNTQED